MKFDILVSGMMLHLLDIANRNSAPNISDNFEENMNELFPKIIDKYRNLVAIYLLRYYPVRRVMGNIGEITRVIAAGNTR